MQLCNRSRNFVRLLAGFLFTGLLVSSPGFAQQPMLIPQPREMRAGQGNFKVTSDLKIVLLPVLADEDRFAAENLAEELKSVTQLDFPIVSAIPAANTNLTAIVIAERIAQGLSAP